MVSTSKILTVSYGTFSCTLEGFDDSFDTMKAIAEYFRDLAADDRYFGAEPPTPDADMLARIAEREVARRVEAHEDNGKIVLRTGAATALPDAAAAAPAGSDVSPARGTPEPADELAAEEGAASPDTMASDISARDEDDEGQDKDLSQDQTTGDSTPIAMLSGGDMVQTKARPAAESVADKLRRIRAVASPEAEPFDDNYSEDEHAQDFLDSTASELDAVLAQDDAAMDTPVTSDDDDYDDDHDDILASLNEGLNTESDVLTDTEARADDVIEHAEDSPGPQDVVEPAAAAEPAENEDHSLESEFAEGSQPSETPELDDLNLDDQSVLDALLEDNDAGGENATEENASSDQHDQDAADDHDDNAYEISIDEQDTLAQLMADAMRGEDLAEAASDAEDTGADVSDTTEVEAKTLEAQDDDAPRPAGARVVKVKRRDLEAAIARDTAPEPSDEEPIPDAAMSGQDVASSLSAEDEADLQRELDAVEAELMEKRGAQTSPQMAEIPVEAPRVDDEDVLEGLEEVRAAAAAAGESDRSKGANRLEPVPADDEAPRIFEEADTHLEEPESNKRRSAIQHLRAAVAATKAEHKAGGEMHPDVDDKPYRLDLESAVRPRRPQAVTSNEGRPARPARPNRDRPAPLKLVAAQRIDTPSSEPVRPRRISRDVAANAIETDAQRDTATPGSAPNGDGFTDFAEQMGAKDLSDLLEAAASYMSDVEGRPEFSRPMLMQKLKEASPKAFSREEGLRSFGKLLREGKLQKLKGGRFAVTDATDFRPGARAAG